jgi:hypothetical protein
LENKYCNFKNIQTIEYSKIEDFRLTMRRKRKSKRKTTRKRKRKTTRKRKR